MTATTTLRDVRSPINGQVPKVDSPAVRARARGSLTITDGEIKLSDRISGALAGWRSLTVAPLSLLEMWRLSAVDRKRIPLDNPVLRGLWLASNWTDRLIMFAVIAVAPTCLTGPLRSVAVRPTRRYGLYLTVGGLTAAYLLTGWRP